MKKVNLLLVILSLMLVFSSCEKKMYIMKIYYIENALDSEIYLSYDNKNKNNTRIPIKLEQNGYKYKYIYHYYLINEDESSVKLDNMEFEFVVEYKDKLYTITNENMEGPSWSKNYYRDTNLDAEGSTNLEYNGSLMRNLHFTTEAYVFSITDEFMESLTPDEE
jgi:hypothetical protein